MLWTIFVILVVLWLLGMVSSYTMGGLIHLLLVVAIVVALVSLIRGRRVLGRLAGRRAALEQRGSCSKAWSRIPFFLALI